MKLFNFADNSEKFSFSNSLAQTQSLFSLRRVGYSLAGAFVVVGAATIVNDNTTADQISNTPSNNYSVKSSTGSDSHSDGTAQSSSASNTTHYSASTDSSGSTNTRLTVNGVDVPVPANSSSQRTTENADGSQTIVSTSNTVSSESANVTSTNVNISVKTDSVTQGGSKPE